MQFIDWFWVVGIIVVIIATQYTKWEDRKDGKRWWEDTDR